MTTNPARRTRKTFPSRKKNHRRTYETPRRWSTESNESWFCFGRNPFPRSRPPFIMLMFGIITIKIHQLFNVFRRTRSQSLAKALNQARFMYQNHQLVIYSEQSSSRFKLMSNWVEENGVSLRNFKLEEEIEEQKTFCWNNGRKRCRDRRMQGTLSEAKRSKKWAWIRKKVLHFPHSHNSWVHLKLIHLEKEAKIPITFPNCIYNCSGTFSFCIWIRR